MTNTDFGYTHIKTVRDGQPLHKLRPAQAVVQYDQKAFNYDLSAYGKGVLKEFKNWVASNFDNEATVYAPWNE